ncbi:Trk system potassium transporter TrkH [Spirochaetia bacterium]|nr:Trk system potassium transporter TrkH [Spirochaetia bacterium]
MRFFKILQIPLIAVGFLVPMLIPPLVLSLVSHDGMPKAYLIPLFIALLLNLPSLFLLKNQTSPLRARDGFLLVTLTWFFLTAAGAMPYIFSPYGISIADSIFESACGFATTGATTFTDIEALPRSLLLWRSICHWAGGMGIIVLTVALLPLFGVGGFQLVKAETPGPDKERITPKITSTAKILWLVYFVLTVVLFVLYVLGGMGIFDAVCHAFTTLATGGVSTKNSGIAFYNSAYLEVVTTIFMLLAAFNFNLYVRALRGKIIDIFNNTEARVYFLIFIVSGAVITINLLPLSDTPWTALRYAFFHTASILSTTGSTLTNYEAWPPLSAAILFMLMFVGGCSGSTACGIKVVRWTVLFKQSVNEVRKAIYPRGVFSVQLNKKAGRKDVVYGVAGFIFLYFFIVAVTTLVTAASGFDLWTSFTAALSVTGNIGAGFGRVNQAGNYGFFPDHIKLFFSFTMIAARLELWTVFVLFTKEYWRG